MAQAIKRRRVHRVDGGGSVGGVYQISAMSTPFMNVALLSIILMVAHMGVSKIKGPTIIDCKWKSSFYKDTHK